MSEFGEMRESQNFQQTVSSLSHQNETQTLLFVTKMVLPYTTSISQYLLTQFLSRPIYVSMPRCHRSSFHSVSARSERYIQIQDY